MKRRGFTIVELVITITIIGILLTLAVVNMNVSQRNARDSERKADAEAIAMQLEAAYSNNTNPSWTGGGTYPGTSRTTEPLLLQDLVGIDPKILRAPDVAESSAISLVPATNNTQTTTGVRPLPSATSDRYIYQPLRSNGLLCSTPTPTDTCRKFNLYYYQESDNSIQMITSKNQ